MKIIVQVGPIFALLMTSVALGAGYDLDVEWRVPAPPKPGSAIYKKDFTELRRWQSVRTEAECKTAAKQNFMSAAALFGPTTGLLNEEEFSVLEPMIEAVIETAEKVAKPYKEEYLRPRPYDTDPELEPCIRKPGGAKSYPSSHALAGMTLGLVLGDVFPAHAKTFRAAGIQIGTNRILGGVHHPSDVGVGQRIGEQMYEALQSNAEFRADIKAAKAALR